MFILIIAVITGCLSPFAPLLYNNCPQVLTSSRIWGCEDGTLDVWDMDREVTIQFEGHSKRINRII